MTAGLMVVETIVEPCLLYIGTCACKTIAAADTGLPVADKTQAEDNTEIHNYKQMDMQA